MKQVNTIYFSIFHTLGDIVGSTAILREIKRKYPNAKLTYAVSKEYTDILGSNPDVDEIIPINHPYEGVLRSQDKPYDKIYLPLQLSQEDSLWHQRYPWCTPGERHNLIDFYTDRCDDDLTITDRRTYVYPQDGVYDAIAKSAGDKEQAFRDKPFITVHTTSRNVTKDWPYESFVLLTQIIAKKYGDKFNIYQIGRDDKALQPPVSFLNSLPLAATIALMEKSKFHIDIDSGPSFIADSLNVPTVCIMGSSSSINSGPIGPNVTFIEPVRKCIGTATHCPCIASKCLINEDCIKTITVEEVFETVDKKLQTIFG